MCLVDIEKAFNRVPGKVMEWTMRKKGLPEVIVKAVMSLYLGEKMKVRVESWCASRIPRFEREVFEIKKKRWRAQGVEG